MSYLLDALRKSERERALGHVPTLDTVHDSAPPHRVRRVVWWLAALLALGLLALLGGWRLHDPLMRIVAGVVAPQATLPPAALPATAAVLAPALTPSPAPSVVLSPGPPPVVGRAALWPKTAAAAAVLAAAGPTGALPTLSKLPDSVRLKMQPMEINVVSYSHNPARRFVMINSQMYREGMELPGGGRLVRVTAAGPVVVFGRHEFLITP